ncbi:MAG: insulinase family protein [Myxococcales bacterium]|nr:insulinase family protein [Myxococcales bacterium]
MIRRAPWWFALVLAACSSHAARPTPPTPPPITAAQPPPDVDAPPAVDGPLPLWSAVKRGTLPNGLTYYVLPHKQPEGRAALWLAVNAGALQEDDDQQGLAHFVEHMAFNGTGKFPKQAIVDYLEQIGMEFGPDVNAYTSFDETVYQLQVPTDDPAFVGTGLDILREWAGDISFDPVEVDKERGVVLEEWRLGRGADERVFTKQAPILFGGTRYAIRLPIGKPEIIKSGPREALVRFYRDWYRPDLMAVIVVGDVDPAAAEAAIRARFGDLVNPATPRPRVGGGALDRSGAKIAIDTDPELRQTWVGIQDMFPHRRESHAIDYRMFVQDALYNRMLGQRLATLARKPDAPFVVAFSSTGDATREFEEFGRRAIAKDGRIADTLEALLTEVARVQRHGFTAAELERAKRGYLKGTADSAAEWDQQDARSYTDELTRHFFQGELVIGRVAEDALARRYTPEVTLDEINHLADAWLASATRAITITAPAKAKGVPTRAEVEAIVAAVDGRTIEPWVEDAVPTSLLAQAPTPGTIVSEQPADDLGVTRWTLSNGAKVIVLPTTFENQRVHLTADSPGGTALVADKRFASARFAVEAVTAGGVGALTGDQLDRVLSDKSVSLWPWLGEVAEGLRGDAATADLPTLLQLVHLRMTAPRKDPDAFAAWQRGRIELLERRDATPEIVMNDAMTLAMSGGHKRRAPVTAAAVRAVDLDTALAVYRERFGDAGDFTFTFVGNVDLKTLRPLVETYLASLPGTGRVEPRKDIGVKPPRAVVKKVVKRGTEPKAYVQLVFHDDLAWSHDAERDVEILGAVLEMRLREILREDMGGVYGVGVWGWVTRAPTQRRQFFIRFGCAPENVEALRAAALAEIARIQQDGVDVSYLDKVKETRRRAHELAVKENDYWLGLLSQAAQFGDDPHEELTGAEASARVTNDNVKASAQRFLSSKRYVSGTLLPAR